MTSSKRKRIMLLILCTIITLVLIISITVLGGRFNGMVFHIGPSTLPITSINGILTALVSMMCVIMVSTDYRTGSVISIGLLILQCLNQLRPIYLYHQLSSVPGILNNMIVMIIILILHKHFAQREKDSTTDYLTELYNRRGLMKQLAEKDRKSQYYFVYVDIDDFKFINDNLGHKCGDQVLRIISERLRNVAGKGAVVSRIGGDEYVFIVPKIVDIDALCQQAINSIGEKMLITTDNGEADCYVSASIGVSCYPNDSSDPEMLMKYSDIAMYQAKRSGKNKFCMFNNSLEDEIKRQAELESIIKESLENNYFYLVYQPQYNSDSKKLRGFETLLRLKTPDGKFVSPGEFIPAAEKTDLILRIDEYVVNRAMREFGSIIRECGNNITLSINVSAKNVCRYGFADMVKEAARNTDFPCECLEIEITEYCLAQSLDIAISNIDKLKELGIQVALDDFGTGYASLSYLSKLSIDLLKIDKSFIDDIGKDKKSNDFVSAVISIGHVHGCHVISEGVENEEQLQLLKEQKCDYIQGYIWGKPLPYDDAVRLTQGAAA